MNDLERTTHFIRAALDALNMPTDVEVEHESDSEFWINLPKLGVSIFLDTEGTVRRGIGGREIKLSEWQVYTVQEIGATREEPADVDLVHRRTFATMAQAVAETFALVTRNQVLCMIESIGAAMDHEEEKRLLA